jgi:hypothetical protein
MTAVGTTGGTVNVVPKFVAGYEDGGSAPADGTRVDEEPASRLRRHQRIEVGLKRVEDLVEVHRSGDPLGAAMERVEVPHAPAPAGAAHSKRVEVPDDRRRRRSRARWDAALDRGQNLGRADANADADPVAGEGDAARPHEAVELVQSGRTVLESR